MTEGKRLKRTAQMQVGMRLKIRGLGDPNGYYDVEITELVELPDGTISVGCRPVQETINIQITTDRPGQQMACTDHVDCALHAGHNGECLIVGTLGEQFVRERRGTWAELEEQRPHWWEVYGDDLDPEPEIEAYGRREAAQDRVRAWRRRHAG